MIRTFATLIVWIVLCGLPAAAVQGGATFTVLVYNDAKVGESVLQQSETVASEIFGRAGLAITWKNCGLSLSGLDLCNGEDEAVFAVRIVRGSVGLSGDAFGVAFVGEDGVGKQADVFYSGITNLASAGPVSTPRILGHVMAHELGHLLLGMNSHSGGGIMQARWTSIQLQQISFGRLLFDKRQSEAMRSRVLGSYVAAARSVTAASVTKASSPLM